MANELDQLRQSTPDLARLDPLSAEVRAWLDRAYDAVSKVDRAEAVILRLHERSLSDPTRRHIASAEIARTIDRTLTTNALMERMGMPRQAAG
jgi:hypothetical protein